MSLQQVDHSCRGVLPIMMRRCVWSGNLKNEEAMTRVGSQRHRKRKVEAVLCTLYLQTLLCLPSVCRRYLIILLVFNVQFLIYNFHLILHCFFFTYQMQCDQFYIIMQGNEISFSKIIWKILITEPDGTWKFFTTSTSTRHLFLSWARSTQVLPVNPTSWTSILIWYSHLHLDLPSGPFPSGRRNYLPCKFVLCMTAYWIDILIDSSTMFMCHLKINRITSFKERRRY